MKPATLHKYREPTPVISSDEEEEDINEGETVYQEAEEYYQAEAAQQSIMSQGLDFVYSSDTDMDIATALEYAFNTRTSSLPDEPRTFSEAMNRPDADLWYKAATDEIQSHLENGTWVLTQLPKGHKAIGCRWVFKVKRNADGSVERYKARLVAKGFSQRPGLEYDETFASTLKWSTLRIILAIAALDDLEVESIDFSTAYLNGELDKEVYMKQPEGFVSPEDEDLVCQLEKGLYGLKQSGRLWYKKLAATLVQMGFKILKSDSSVYILDNGIIKVILPVFVDDCTLVSKSKSAIQDLKQKLLSKFKLRDLGSTKLLLGVATTSDHSKHSISLSQKHYVEDILTRTNITAYQS